MSTKCMEVLHHYIVYLKLIFCCTLMNWNLNKNFKKLIVAFFQEEKKRDNFRFLLALSSPKMFYSDTVLFPSSQWGKCTSEDIK